MSAAFLRVFRALSVSVGAVAVAVAGAQQPLHTPSHYVTSSTPYDGGLFTPVEDLHALSATQYTTLQHPNFPTHSVRIKQSHFCDGEVQYVTVSGFFTPFAVF